MHVSTYNNNNFKMPVSKLLLVAAVLGVASAADSRWGLKLGNCKRSGFAKMSVGTKVMIDKEGSAVDKCMGELTGCLLGCSRQFGEKLTVKIDCFHKIIDMASKGEKASKIYDVKQVHDTEERFDYGEVCPPETPPPRAVVFENEYKKYDACSHKKCKVGQKVQVKRSIDPEHVEKYRDLLGCTGTLKEVIAPTSENAVMQFMKKHLLVGKCVIEVDTGATNLAGEKCVNVDSKPQNCNSFLRLPEGAKRAEYVHRCADEKFCKANAKIQMNSYAGNSDDAKFWRSCYGTIAKVGKTLFGSPKYHVKLACTKKMLKEGNDCCWPSNDRNDNRLAWVKPELFRLK